MAEFLGFQNGDARLEGVPHHVGVNKTRLSHETVRILAEKLGFDPGWPQWSNGSAREFADRYNRENWHGREARPQKTEERPAEARDTTALLKRGQLHEPTRSKIKGMASIEIDGQQFGHGTADIELIISCGMPMIGGANITVKRALVELDCGKARLTKESHSGWIGKAQRIERDEDNSVNISFGGGDRAKPIWRLAADVGGLGSIVLEPGFVAVEGLSHKDRIEAEFGTWLMDIEDTETDLPAAEGGLVDGLVLVDCHGKELPSTDKLSKLKRNVISCIRKSVIPAVDGYVALAGHVLEVVKADDEH